MKLLTGLFRFARKRCQTTDNDMGQFREKLTELVTNKDSLSDEDVVTKVEELKGYVTDLPDGEDKAKLDRFLEDFKSVKEQEEAPAKEAANMVADLFEKLDTEAMKDVPDVETPAEETAEVAVEETVAPDTESEDSAPGETDVEKLAAEVEENKEVKDDANSGYTLEEIYQFIKKRMAEDNGAEDACATDGAEEVEEEEKKEGEEEVVTDHAPFVPVTMNGTAAKGTLADMFAQIKNGGR